ncbi:MAG: hypothetical protein A3C11_03165 [Candidatus Sungbacteria bacterium RIFCSPHIGHO2_02_FULL_49_12]|uniref:Baseplate protein J-like domain-containing protein n=1 Tax=Candidatus Sungbacteria bacterium RIFCSPHIGHO2_02_FULL_49_12 TaxID=1802271 RepID=A0A1G2KN47_9BACT|nr:MAG: hypothetical protein A3C11_03165 [Candidatus Sungbacteria bacterium RIFCSPHIGHO2_02_FULL_49_12]
MPTIPISNKNTPTSGENPKRSRSIADIVAPRTGATRPREDPPILKKVAPKPEPIPVSVPASAPVLAPRPVAATPINPVRTGAWRSTDGSSTPTSAISNDDRNQWRSNGVKKSALPPEESKEIERIDRSVAEFFVKKPAPAASPATQRLEEPLSVRSWKPERTRIPLRVWLWGGGGLGALAAVIILLSTIFARVLINIRPFTETLTLPPVALRVSPSAQSIDASQGVIPGEYIEFSDQKQFQGAATGKQFVNSKARGVVTISNAYSSQPQVLVANTRFVTTDGKVFRLEKSVTVPGAKVDNGNITPNTITATIVASAAGDQYNIGPSDFVIPGFQGTPKYKTFTAKSDAAFTGGLVGEAVVATDADIKKAVESATADMFNSLRDSLNNKIPPGFNVVDGARQVAITNVDAPPAKFPGATFQVTVSGKVQAIAFRPPDEGNLIAALFSTTTPRVFIPAKSSVDHRSVALDIAKKQLSFVVAGSIALGTRLDSDALAAALAGKSADDITSIIRGAPGIEAFKMKFFPFWLWRAPSDQTKVKITIEPFPGA